MNIPIIFSTDHNYVMQTGVTILSLLGSATEAEYDINIIINSDVTEDDKKLLRRQISYFPRHSINFTYIGKAFEGCYEVRGISIASYSRLLIPWLFPHFDKIIYCDVDAIINIDLTSLYNENLTNYLVAAVPSVAARIIPSNRQYITSLGLNPDDYCNAGVLVINSKKQRDLNLKQQFILESQKKYVFQDQDIINIVCRNQIKHISPQYNLTPYFYQLVFTNHTLLKEYYGSEELIRKFLRSEECILHYAGPKPWNTFTYAWIDWWQVYRESIFFDYYYECEISKKILNQSPSWRKIASLIKQKLKL